jgi:RecA/RadA recombinase
MKKRRKEKSIESTKSLIPDELIPTGCTILNCILSDNAFGGYRKGSIVNLIGDSSAGKSILADTTFAAVNSNSQFDDYELIHDDAEAGSSFDMEYLFGKSTAKRIKAPAYDSEGTPIHSDTIEDFHMHVKQHLRKEKPFIYVLDSFDSVDADADREKIKDAMKKREQGKDSSGSYGTAKARKASDLLRNIRLEIKKTNSLLIIVSQVRDNLNAGTFGSKKTRSGGKALKHYSWHEIWLYLGQKLKSKEKVIGVESLPRLGKNRQTGKYRDGKFPIYYDLGIDDIGANIDFLLEEKHWEKKKQTIIAEELGIEGTKAKIIDHIEKNNLEIELQKCVQKCWSDIEESLKLNRKRRFE